MSKVLRFTYNEKDYVLEFTRATIREMENSGFKPSDLADKPSNLIPRLFEGSFLARHRGIRKAVVEEIFAHMTNKTVLLEKLLEMYQYPIETLLEEPEESEGNVKWTVDW